MTDKGTTISSDTIPQETSTEAAAIRYISFGSGSSGNCTYIGDSEMGFLVDAGIDVDIVFSTLKSYGISASMVKAIIVTHDHCDHIKYAYKIIRKYKHIRILSTIGTFRGMLRRHVVSSRITEYHAPFYKETPFHLRDFTITPFEVSHDGTDNCGFFIEYKGLKLTIATDLGFVSERVRYYVSQANFLMLESNYDAEMLRMGKYPEYLKRRIMGSRGHLSNSEAAHFVSTIYTPELRNIFLCHLSHENNTPEKALLTMRETLSMFDITVGDFSEATKDCDVQLIALPRHTPTPLYTLSL